MNRLLALALAACVFLADQAAKYFVMVPLDLANRPCGQIDLNAIFRLIWVKNPGVSMGFLVARTPFQAMLLTLLTGAIALAVLVWLWRERSKTDTMALGLVLGGALGNITDRVRFGHVIDFANIHFGDVWNGLCFESKFSPFLVFNVADAAISIGVVILLARALFASRAKTKAADHA